MRLIINNQVRIHLGTQRHNIGIGIEDLLAVSGKDKPQMTKQVPREHYVAHKYFFVWPAGYIISCCEHALGSI